MRSIFVVVEVALALVLLSGAALMIRSFAALRAVNTGIDAQNILTLEMSLTGTRFRKTEALMQVVREAERRVGAIPGVAAVASSWMLPIENAFSSNFVIEGRPLEKEPVHGGALMRPVSAQYFAVFRIPLLRGRLFTAKDNASAPGVVVISDAMAKKFWPEGRAIGERVSIDKYLPGLEGPPREIIGIVADVRNAGIKQQPDPMMYMPQAQAPDGLTAIDARIIPITWVVHTKVDPYSLNSVIQEELRKASGGLPVSRVRSMAQVVRRSTARSDFNTLLLAAFAGIALLLAGVGVYGLVSYSVQQRTQEIGIRMALGATPEQVRNAITFRAMGLALGGIVLGVVAATGCSRVMKSLIFGVETSDPAIYATAAAVLALAALLASYLPARRATQVDPASTLRSQ